MNKTTLLIISLIITIFSYGQKVEINSNGLFLESQQITKNTSPELLHVILGLPEKKTNNLIANNTWTYVDLGLRIVFDRESGKIAAISLDLIKRKDGSSPGNSFSGELIVNGHNISRSTPIDSVSIIPSLTIEDTLFHVYFAKTNNFELTLFYEDETNLQVFGIIFNDSLSSTGNVDSKNQGKTTSDVYINDKYSYQIEFPESWTINSDQGPNRIYASGPAIDKLLIKRDGSYGIIVAENMTNISLKKAVKKNLQDIKSVALEFRLINQEEIQINGQDVVQVIFEVKMGDFEITSIQYYLLSNENLYTFGGSVPSDFWKSYEGKYMAISQTFKILN